jgi:hypothetical protein
MLRRAAIAALLVALAVGVAAPPPAWAVPVPMETCAPAVAPGALPCLRSGDDGDDSALAAVARSGATVLWKVWNATALVFF